MNRIEKLCSYIKPCASFADVGCDHGYCAELILKSGKCADVIISDVSAKSLSKAEKLLAEYIRKGQCRPVCCDGLELIPESTETVLIAGMGGEEIIKILSQGFIPQKFVLQPMKNADKVRSFLIEAGCKITADDIFKDEKYYFVIAGERSGGTREYSEEETAFGRDSLKNSVLKEFAAVELEKKKRYLSQCADESAAGKLAHEIKLLTEVTK